MDGKDFAAILIYGDQQRRIHETQDELIKSRVQAHEVELKNKNLTSKIASAAAEKQTLLDDNEELLDTVRALRAAYEKERELLADWMVSQKAFKELAIQFGMAQGKTPEEVIQMGLAKEIDVLNGVHDPRHNTNATSTTRIRPFIEKLKARINKS